MKYTSSHGTTSYYKKESLVVNHTIQMDADYSEAYEVLDVMDILWEVAGNLIQEVKAQPVYHTPEGKVRRAFDIYILTGVKIIFGKTAVNKLMMEIEAEIEKRLPVTLVQRHTLGKAVVPNFGYSSRTKLRTTAL